MFTCVCIISLKRMLTQDKILHCRCWLFIICKCRSWLSNGAALQLFQMQCLFCHCHWHELELTASVANMVATYVSDQLVCLIKFFIDCILVRDLLSLTLIKSMQSGSLTTCSTLTIARFWCLATPSSYTTYSVYTV